jgi:hypothetical protein
MLCEQYPILLEPQQIKLMRQQINSQKCYQHDFVQICSQSYCMLLHILKETGTYYAITKLLHTTLSILQYAEGFGEVHVGCL